MSHTWLLLLLFCSSASAASLGMVPLAQTEERLGRMEQQINELKTSVSRLRSELQRLHSRIFLSKTVSCKPNWFPIYLNGSFTHCLFASAYPLPWDKAAKQCQSQNSQLLAFGGEVTRAGQLETAVQNTLWTAALRGKFWIGLRKRQSGLAWRNGSALNLRTWNGLAMRDVVQPCGVLWLQRTLWDFNDCRDTNRWLCIRQPQV